MGRPQSAMIFAAGFGTRMAPLTHDRPKPLIKVAGRPLLDHALDLVSGSGASAIVNAHYRADMVVTHLAKRPNTKVICETPDILDTGGGLKAALPLLGTEPVYTLNSDAIWAGPSPLQTLAANWDPEEMGALLLLVPIEQTVGYSRAGNFALDAQGRLSRSETGLVYTGAQILHTSGLAEIEHKVFSLNVLWDQLMAEGRLFGVPYSGRWADVGTPDGITLAEQMLDDHADV